jgi:beta-xylosidase
VVFGSQWYWLAVEKSEGNLNLCLYSGADHKQLDNIRLEASVPWNAESGLLRVSVDSVGRCRFSYRTVGRAFQAIGGTYQATEGTWVGAKVGLICQSSNTTESKAFADFDWFRVENISE